MGLESVDVSGSVEKIGDFSFYGCMNLKEVKPTEGLKSIGENAFAVCTSLESILMPDSVGLVGDYAFYGCMALRRCPDILWSLQD